MTEVKNLLLESGVGEIFRLIVTSGSYAGTYDIKKPDGFDDFDCIVDINEERFNVENFIIGKEIKLGFLQYSNPIAYDLLKNVYEEQGGDGQIIFKWLDYKNGVENDILGDNFEINLNLYEERYEQSMLLIETELKLRESQNKMLVREEVSVDLFAQESLDGELLPPLNTVVIGYEKEPGTLNNFYSQAGKWRSLSYRSTCFFRFNVPQDLEFGVNTNTFAGEMEPAVDMIWKNPFFYADTNIGNLKAEFSNINVLLENQDNTVPTVQLLMYTMNTFGLVESATYMKTSTPFSSGVNNYAQFLITNETFNLGSISSGKYVTFVFYAPADNVIVRPQTDNGSITLMQEVLSPLVKTQAVKLGVALDRICDIYTGGDIGLDSRTVSTTGYYTETMVSTGSFMRGLPPLYAPQKFKTSLKNLLYEGVCPLLALGFDITHDKMIVESVDYFFKQIQIADLTDKPFDQEELSIQNDLEITVNELVFGSKKYSTKNKFDTLNFNTKLEAVTPTITRKKKFDKQTELIIDQFKISEISKDNSTATNDNDDDIVLIDLVNKENEIEVATFPEVRHSSIGGYLTLESNTVPFDTTYLDTVSHVLISSTLNNGYWEVLNVTLNKMILNKTTGIQSGVQNTTLSYIIPTVLRNRTLQGFTNIGAVKFPENSVNLRHNPKYQLARWFPFYGSGLMKKGTNEEIKVTDYKNNKNAQMQVSVGSDAFLLLNELQGLVTTGNNETLGRLRAYKQPFFNGKTITVKLYQVTFKEFMQLYKDWRFGLLNDRFKSRGYITVDIGNETVNIFPFGSGAFNFDRLENSLTISGKIGRKTPIFKTVFTEIEKLEKNEVRFRWNADGVFEMGEASVQFSLDGVNFTTLDTITEASRIDIESDLFTDILTGTDVYFRMMLSDGDYLDYSEHEAMVWTGNDWVAIETLRSENYGCNTSQLRVNLKGDGIITLTAEIEEVINVGKFRIENTLGEVYFDSEDSGLIFTDDFDLSEGEITFIFTLENAKEADGYGLDCMETEYPVNLSDLLSISFSDGSYTKEFELTAEAVKYHTVDSGSIE